MIFIKSAFISKFDHQLKMEWNKTKSMAKKGLIRKAEGISVEEMSSNVKEVLATKDFFEAKAKGVILVSQDW